MLCYLKKWSLTELKHSSAGFMSGGRKKYYGNASLVEHIVCVMNIVIVHYNN